ncbi:hypothetical protein [Streptomyces sp. MMBL 11-3]|uniref:hypothetical protein n=1 Tax=Streptomyces sp. MMBL 11-3 TaxID=3382639 RepID=UPI0039B38F76
MRSYIGHHQVVTADECVELAYPFDEQPLGLDIELFRSPLRRESAKERRARLDVAREVLAELNELAEDGDEIAGWDALYADALTRTVPFLRSVRGHRAGTGEAA